MPDQIVFSSKAAVCRFQRGRFAETQLKDGQRDDWTEKKKRKKRTEMLEMVSESFSRPLVSVYPNLELTTFE
jgi:hypothetical protein